jgi:hypothetical protein
MKTMFKAVVRWARGPVRRVPAEAMPAEDVADALAEIAGSGAWVAIHQELDAAIADAVDEATSPPVGPGQSLNAEARAFHAGGVDHLRRFQARLLSFRPTGPE